MYMYPRSLSSILASATLWCLQAAPSFELVVSRAPCTAVCAASSASRVRAPCVVLSPALGDAHAAAAGAEPRANVPRVRLTCSRARTESRPIEACSGKRAAHAGAHQLLLRPRRWRAERRPLSPRERLERRRRLRAVSERFAATSLQQHAAEPVCRCVWRSAATRSNLKQQHRGRRAAAVVACHAEAAVHRRAAAS